jgi:putative methyltransferase (TIGR04325 family)
LPRHLLINRTAIHPSRACITLQNIRWMISPYHIFQRENFIQEIESLGYTLIDDWQDATHSCWIPFYPEHSVPSYTGFYFRRD